MSGVSEREGEGDLLEREEALEEGTEVGEYVVRRVLGAGTFGMVYAAEHPLIGKQAAVKVLHRRYMAVPEVVSRFIAEARAVNKIRHRNIIDVFSIGKLPGGQQYLIMELLEGETLDPIMKRRRRLPFGEAYPILRGIADGLDAAHAAGIIHRDLKPDNVFVSRSSDGYILPKILDFGIAKLIGDDEAIAHRTKTGLAVGTPLYMSPEQCRAKKIDTRTDIYAFGVMIFQMLSGTIPYDGESAVDVMFKHMSDDIPDVSKRCRDLPSSLDAPIAKMLAKKPRDRHATAGAALRDLVAAAIEGGLDVGDEAARVSQLDLEAAQVSSAATRPVTDERPTVREPQIFGPPVGMGVGATDETLTATSTQRSPHDLATPAPASPLQIDLEEAKDESREGSDEAPILGTSGHAAVAASTAALSSAKEAERPTSWWKWPAAAIALAAALGLVFTFSSQRDDATPASPPSEPPAEKVAAGEEARSPEGPVPIEAPAPAPAAKPAPVTVTLALRPADATVHRGDEQLPFEGGKLTLPHGEEAITLTLRRPGYAERELELTPNRDQALEASLVARGAFPAPAPAPPKPSRGENDILTERD